MPDGTASVVRVVARHARRRAGYHVAVDGEHDVGMSHLWRSPDAGKAHGFQRVGTENETDNQGMIAINDRLGFIKNPAWMHYVKSFAP